MFQVCIPRNYLITHFSTAGAKHNQSSISWCFINLVFFHRSITPPQDDIIRRRHHIHLTFPGHQRRDDDAGDGGKRGGEPEDRPGQILLRGREDVQVGRMHEHRQLLLQTFPSRTRGSYVLKCVREVPSAQNSITQNDFNYLLPVLFRLLSGPVSRPTDEKSSWCCFVHLIYRLNHVPLVTNRHRSYSSSSRKIRRENSKPRRPKWNV